MSALTLRLPQPLHRLVRIAAASRGLSAHAWMLGALRGGVLRAGRRRGPVRAALGHRRTAARRR